MTVRFSPLSHLACSTRRVLISRPRSRLIFISMAIARFRTPSDDPLSLALHTTATNEAVTTCCSDALTRSAGMSVELRLQCLRNLTDLLHRTFKGQFVFPALGHEDVGVNYTQLANLWQHWLPPEALDTFVKGEQTSLEGIERDKSSDFLSNLGGRIHRISKNPLESDCFESQSSIFLNMCQRQRIINWTR